MNPIPRKISASLMCADFLNLKETVQILNETPFDYIHFDIMDGSFSPDYLMGKKLIQDIRSVSSIRHEYHLMIKNPAGYIDHLPLLTGDQVIVHYELCDAIGETLVLIKQKGALAAVAIDAPTPPSVIEPYRVMLDMVLVMLIHAGSAGAPFWPTSLEKIPYLQQKIVEWKVPMVIGVDGSVNSTTIPRLKELGVTHFVGGSTGLFLPNVPLAQAAIDFKNLVTS